MCADHVCACTSRAQISAAVQQPVCNQTADFHAGLSVQTPHACMQQHAMTPAPPPHLHALLLQHLPRIVAHVRRDCQQADAVVTHHAGNGRVIQILRVVHLLVGEGWQVRVSIRLCSGPEHTKPARADIPKEMTTLGSPWAHQRNVPLGQA